MKVVLLDVVHGILQQRLEQKNIECIDGTDFSIEYCKKNLTDVDGLVIRSRFPMNESFLENLPQLKFIARSGAGMENIDEVYCQKRKITLFNAPEGNRNAVAEHALAMLLNLLNNIKQGDQEVRNGLWRREENRGYELDGKTVGIIGFGNNGQAFAKKLRGFDVEVLVYDKYLQGFGSEYIKEASLSELYEKSDVISFHIPQNEETIYWCDETFFTEISKPFYLLNLSRGKLVRTKALLEAIDSGKVLGAGLDVLEFEKTSFENMFDSRMTSEFSKLLKCDKVILTPHVGGWTHESYFKLSNILADKIIDYYQL